MRGVYRQNVLLPHQFETEIAQGAEDCGDAGEWVALVGASISISYTEVVVGPSSCILCQTVLRRESLT